MKDIDRISISKFSAITKITPRALRLYERKELFEPAIRDPVNNYRYYGLDQISEALRIKMLATMGFGIEEIKNILDAASNGDDEYLGNIFARKQSEVQLEIQRLGKIEEIIRSHDPMELLQMSSTEPKIKEVPSMRVVAMRKTGTYSSTISELINLLMREIYAPNNQKELKITGPIMFISYDQEYKETDADIEVAIPISGRISLNNDQIEVKNLEGITAVSLVYTGAYADIGPAYSRAFDFAIRNNFEIAGPSREIYLNDPNSVSASELMTEVQIPLMRN